MSYLQALRLFSRNTRLYLFSSALVGFCFYGIYTVLFNLYLLRLGYGSEFIGLANAALWVPIVLFALPAGMLGQRWGVRATLIVGAVIMIAGLGLPPFAGLLPASLRSAWILSTYPLLGLGAALYMVNGDPFLMGSTGPGDRDQAFSAMLAISPLAGFIGSIVAGLLPGVFAAALEVPLDHPASYRYPLWIAAALFALTVPAFLATDQVSFPGAGGASPGPSTPPAQRERKAAVYVVIGLLALVALLRVSGENATLTFLNLYMDAGLGASTAQIGILSAVGQLVGGPVSLVMPHWPGAGERVRSSPSVSWASRSA